MLLPLAERMVKSKRENMSDLELNAGNVSLGHVRLLANYFTTAENELLKSMVTNRIDAILGFIFINNV